MGRLDEVDLSLKLSEDEEAARLAAGGRRLTALRLWIGGKLGASRLGPPVLIQFEGWDASGKGGAIRRLVAPLDPRYVQVIPFGPPTDEEKRHHFLWRFSKVTPGWGDLAIFDRTWYGRVLVERVEGLATVEQWERAYTEMVEYERALAIEGVIHIKFFVHIDADEQLKRFERRRNDPLKSWKLTDDDWHNRSLRPEYERAIDDMLERTDHEVGRWHVVEGNSKRWARVKILETTIYEIERGLKERGFDVPDLHS